MRRRTILNAAALLPFTLRSPILSAEPRPRERRVDVAVIGGGTGGCAAALAAARAGASVLLTEEID